MADNMMHAAAVASTRKSRRGAALVLTAISLTALIGAAAIAIDLGMLYKARADAERAAEAAALAGASAFMELAGSDSASIHNLAVQRAQELATANGILTERVTTAEVQNISVLYGEEKVRVTVGRSNVSTWFAKILGSQSIPVNATAAAQVEAADGVNCVKPFMVPDAWADATQDANGNRLEDGTENWTFDPNTGDTYAPLGSPPTNDIETGFGSGFRNGQVDGGNRTYNGDFGRQITLAKARQNGNGGGNGGNGNGGGGNGNGGNGNGNGGNGNGNGNGGNGGGNTSNQNAANSYTLWKFEGGSNGNPELRQAIEGCRDGSVSLDDIFEPVPGNHNGLGIQTSVQRLINQDLGANYDPTTGTIRNSRFGDWRSSPRVIKLALFDPNQFGVMTTGNPDVQFNNIALFFVESVDNQDAITGRFFYYVNGTSGPSSGTPSGGSLVKHVRLVE